MVLLSFAGQDQADSFYGDFNGLPFSSLEPDILCRCVCVGEGGLVTAELLMPLMLGRLAAYPVPATFC
jgi:hypothetical protein